MLNLIHTFREGIKLANKRLEQEIEELRAEMVRIASCHSNFTDYAVVSISQKLDSLLNDYANQ
jgi:hypothetical protein